MAKRLYVTPNDYVELGTDKPLDRPVVTLDAMQDIASMAFLPNPDEVLKAMGKAIDVYRSITYDAKVKASVGQLTSGVKALEWDVDRGRARSRYKRELEEWTKDYDLQSFIEAHVAAWLYGYQPMEAPWEVVGTQWFPQQFVAKPQEWFVHDPHGFWKYVTKDNKDGVALPSEKNFLFPTFGATYTNPYGVGALSGCFWPVTFKRGGLRFWLTFVEKFGMPHVVIKVPPGAGEEEKAAALSAGRRMIQDAVLVITDTQSYEIVEAAGKSASSDLYRELLAYSDDQIALSIIHQTMSSDVSDKGGGYASSKTGETVLDSAVAAVAGLVQQSMSRVYRAICEVNWGTIDAPTFMLYEESETDSTVAERDSKVNEMLGKAGKRLSAAYFQKAYKLDDEDIEDTAAEEPKPAAAPEEPQPVEAFAESDTSEFPDQAAVDRLADGLTDEELQSQMDGVLQPVINAIARASNYAEALELLAATYPDMDGDRLQNALARMLYESEIRGRIAEL